MLKNLLSDVDRLLRSTPQAPATSRPRLLTLLLAGLVLGAVYGACMGLYALLADRPDDYAPHLRWLQLASTTIKVPLVFLLTYAICAPSLYVFATLAGSRGRPLEVIELVLARNAECLAVVASLGPITVFFTLSTESYGFMKLLSVAFLSVGGATLVARLWQSLQHVPSEMEPQPPRGEDASEGEAAAASVEGAEPPAPPPLGRRLSPAPGLVAKRVLGVWLILLGVVGSQVAWIMRPFLGAPDLPFSLFRAREGSFFEDLGRTLFSLLS